MANVSITQCRVARTAEEREALRPIAASGVQQVPLCFANAVFANVISVSRMQQVVDKCHAGDMTDSQNTLVQLSAETRE